MKKVDPMYSQRRSRARLAVATAVGIFTATAMHPRASAAPSESCDHPQLRAQVVELLVADSEPLVALHLHTDVITTIRTSSRIRSADAVDPQAISFVFGQHELMVKPNPDRRRNTTKLGELRAKTTDGPLALNLRLATDPSMSIGLALVRPRLPGDKDRATLTSLGSICSLRTKLSDIQTALTTREQELATKLAELEAKDAEIIEQSARHSRELRDTRDRTFMTHVDDSTFSVTELDDQGCSGDDVILCPRLYTRSDNRAVLLVEARNRTNRTIPIQQARAVDKHSSRDHALLFGITDSRQRSTTLIEPGEGVKVTVLLSDPDRIGGSLRLTLNGASSALPASEWVVIPSPIKQAEQEFERRKRQRRAERVSLHATATYGAIWLPAAMDGVNEIATTSIAGIGARVTKGLHPNWAVEVDITGATTGDAVFRNVSDTGDSLVRSALLGRVSFAGVLRLGERVIPTLRLGLGVEFVDWQPGSFGDSSKSGSAGIDITEVLLFGGGVDFRIRERIVAGVGLSLVAPRNAELFERTFEGRGHVSYAWGR